MQKHAPDMEVMNLLLTLCQRRDGDAGQEAARLEAMLSTCRGVAADAPAHSVYWLQRLYDVSDKKTHRRILPLCREAFALQSKQDPKAAFFLAAQIFGQTIPGSTMERCSITAMRRSFGHMIRRDKGIPVAQIFTLRVLEEIPGEGRTLPLRKEILGTISTRQKAITARMLDRLPPDPEPMPREFYENLQPLP